MVRFNPDVYGSAEVSSEIDILYIIKNSTRCAYATGRKLLHYCAIDMAAPDGTDILDVTGLWSLNRTLSDSLEETFALVSWQISIRIGLTEHANLHLICR